MAITEQELKEILARVQGGQRAPEPRPRHAVGFFLILIFVPFTAMFLITSGLETLGIEPDLDSQPVSALLIVVQALVILGVVWSFLWEKGFDPVRTLRLRPAPRFTAYVWGVVGLIALGVITAQLGALLVRAVPALASESLAELVRLARFTDPISFVAYALAVSLGPGISEEVAFRGVVLSGFRSRYSPATAVGVSALLFALMHLDPLHALLAFPAGLWLGFLVVRTGSLYPAVAAHALNNLWSTLEAAYWQAARPGLDPLEVVLGLYPWPVVLMALGALLVALRGLLNLEPVNASANAKAKANGGRHQATPGDRAGARGA